MNHIIVINSVVIFAFSSERTVFIQFIIILLCSWTTSSSKNSHRSRKETKSFDMLDERLNGLAAVDSINPAVPSTVGALLAEEWTIDPFSTMPSFLEMVLMRASYRSAQESLLSGLQLLQHRLTAYGHRVMTQQERSHQAMTVHRVVQRWLSILTRRIGQIVNHLSPEVSYLALYAMQRQSLKSSAEATIAESLYGGKPERLEKIKGRSTAKLLSLSVRDKTRLAMCVTFVPYFRHRLLWLYRMLLSRRQRRGALENGSALELAFMYLYPLLHVSLCSLDTIYHWRYFLGHSVFFDPYSQLLGIIVRRVTQEDNTASGPASTSKRPSSSASSSSARSVALGIVGTAIALSGLAHIRIQWRRQREQQTISYNENNRISSQSNDQEGQPMLVLESLPPPPPLPAAREQVYAATTNKQCPICRRPRVLPAASPAGFVFCFRCIVAHLREHGICPVSGITCDESQIVRLFEPQQQIQES